MGLQRLTTVVALVFLATAGTSSAQCVSEVREIISRTQVPGLVAGPAAWNGSVVAVAVHQPNNGAVWSHVYSERGDLLYPPVRISGPEGDEIVENLWNGDHFGIFIRTDNGDLVLRRLSTTGEVLGPPVVPLPGRLQEDDRADIIWSSRLNAYVVARTTHTSPRAVIVTILNRDGSRRRVIELEPNAPQSFIRILETESGVIAVFFERDVTRDVMMVTVGDDRANVIRKVWPAGEDPVIQTWDNQFVLVRAYDQPDGRAALRWKIINTTGFDTRPEARLLVGSGQDVRPVALMFRAGEFALTYLDARDGFEAQTPSYRLVRFTPAGDIITDTYFAAVEPQRHRAASEHDIIWTGSAYLAVAVRDTGDGGGDSFFIRLCPLRARVTGPALVARNTTATFVAAPEGGIPGFTYEWRHEVGIATGPTLQRTHDVNGTYTVELTVKDNSGAVSRETFTYVVYDPAQVRRRAVRK